MAEKSEGSNSAKVLGRNLKIVKSLNDSKIQVLSENDGILKFLFSD